MLISDKPIINHSFLFHTEQCHIPSGCTNQYSGGTIHIWNQLYSSSAALRFAGRPISDLLEGFIACDAGTEK